jgi:fibronectin type 3 domain-containing protein
MWGSHQLGEEMKFNIYKATSVGLALLVVATIFANPFKGSAPQSFDLVEENQAPQRAPASLDPPVVARQFYAAPPVHPIVGGTAFQNPTVSNLQYNNEIPQVENFNPGSTGFSSGMPAYSGPIYGGGGGATYGSGESSSSREPAKEKDSKKEESKSSSDDTSPSNSAVGSYGGLPDASPAGNLGTTGTSHSDAGNPASPPIIISAVGAPGSVELSWQAAASTSPVTYSVERSLSAGSGFSVIAAGVSGTTYTDNTAINGTLYYYRVASLNASGGAYSEVISALASDLPTTPTLVVSASDGVGSLSWNTSTGTGVITYSVERSLTSGSGFGVVTSGLASPNFTDSSLTDGTLYYYRVQAHNAAGDSNYSPEVTAKPIDAFILGTATAGIESVVLTWNSAVGATAYDVKYGTASGTYTTTLTNKTSPFTITGLTANTTYYFSVKATNSDHGLTLSTNELSAKPLGVFTITSLTPTDIGKLKIIWSASSGATSYDIGCGTTTGDYTAITLTNQTSPTTITGLSNATTYYCQVTAKNATGQGNATTEASATTFSLLTYNWPFDAATDAAYSFDASKLELVGGVSRLKNLAPTDASYVGNDFKDALFSGVKWDSANSKITLDSASDDGELNSQWTPQYNNIVGYWKLNGTSGSSIAQGDVIPATIGQNLAAHASGAVYQGGVQRQGILKDVNSHFVSNPNFMNVAGDITVQLWAKTTATSVQVLAAKYGGTDHGWEMVLQANGTIGLDGRTGTGVYQTSGPSTTAINDNRWHHIVGSRQGATFKIFVDGKLENSTVNDAGSFVSPNPLVLGGQDENNTTYAFIGSMDEAAIWNSALSAAEVKTIYERQHARYTGTILSRVMDSGVSTSWAGLSYLTQLPYGKELPNSGISETNSAYPALAPTSPLARSVAYQSFDSGSVAGKIGNAKLFNGTSDHVTDTSFSALDGKAAVTVTAWVKQNPAGITNLQEVARQENTFAFQLKDGKANFYIFDTTWRGSGQSAAITNDGAWHFLVGQYDGSHLAVWIDNTKVADNTYGPTTIATHASNLEVGAIGTAGAEFFDGSMDEFAIYDRALTPTEMTTLYGLKSDLMADNVGLWHFNETSGSTLADSSGNSFDGATVGSPVLGAPGKFNKSVTFSNGNHVAVPHHSALSPTKALTLSTWIKTTDTSTYQFVIAKNLPNGYEGYDILLSNGSPRIEILSTLPTYGNLVVGPQVNDGKWHHLVATYGDSTIKMFVDGALAGTLNYTGGMLANTQDLIIGNRVSLDLPFHGSIDEVGIWSRALSDTEVKQLYQRGANRILLQARTCSAADCSDDAANANWRGSANNNTSYLSELNNSTVNSPQFLFSNFGVSLTNNPYFQYRAILESDDSATAPDLVSVSAGPARYDGSNPTIIPVDGPKFQIYTGFTTTLGASCSGTPKFQLSHDKKTWYYYSAGMWNTTTAGVTQASDSSTINTNIATFGAVAGTGELYAKVFYPSDTSTACEIDKIAVAGADSSSTNSSNPNAFTISSITSTNTTATLNWNAASGATSYKICYGTTQALANACATYVTVTGTSTTVTGLTNDTRYYFAIQALNTSGVTVSNNPVYTTPMAIPSVPTPLVATNGIQVINLLWNASTGSGTITYNIKRATTTTGPYTTIATGVTTTAYSDSSATPGTPYYYVVTATNPGGTSANSMEATSTAMSLVSYVWTFDPGTDSSYTFDSSKIQLAGGVCRLTNATPTDASFIGNDFKAATLSGVKWDSANNKLTLDSASDDGELNSQWTPKYDKIVGYWKLNGTNEASIATGTVIPSTVGIDLIAQNPDSAGMKFTVGKQSQGVLLDGVNDSMTSSPVDFLGASNDFTISSWIKPDATQADWASVIDWSHCGGQNFILQHYSNTPDLYNFAYFATDSQFKQSQFTLTANQWQHVLMTKSGTNVQIFVNGVRVINATYDVGTILKNSAIFMLGEGGTTCVGRPFKGGLDEVAVWKSSISGTEARAIYEHQRARYTGTILSRIMSSGASTSWEGLSYLTSIPYGKEILGNTDPEAQYPQSNAILPAALTSGLTGYWHFDETTGTTIADSSGQGNNGSTINGPTLNVTGVRNQGIQFNQGATVDQRIELNTPLITGTSDFTFGGWFYTTSNSFGNYIAGNYDGPANDGLEIYTMNGKPGIYIAGDYVFSNTTLNTNQWYHIAVTRIAGAIKIYINGALDFTGTAAGVIPSGRNFVFGNGPGYTSERMRGSLDEFATWNRGLSPAEVVSVYEHTRSLGSQLVGLWHLNETSGTTLSDSSGNGNHATLTGSYTLDTAGKLNQAVTFDGVGSYATGSLDSSKFVDEFTLSAWFNHKATTQWGAILSMNTGAHVGEPAITMIDTTNSIGMNGVGVTASYVGVDLGADHFNQWIFVTVRKKGNNLFVDAWKGDQHLSSSGPIPFTMNSTSNGFLIGRHFMGDTQIFNGSIDEVGAWGRALSDTEILQLYQRGANRVKLQARSCANSDCSDDPTGLNWKGSANTANSYFSEVDNKTAGVQNTHAPVFTFSDFGVSLTNNPYFQYRAILESDGASALPDLTSVSAGPGRYDGSKPVVIPVDGPKYQILTSFTVLLGAGGCSGTPKFQISSDKTNWYYYNSGWTAAPAASDISKASAADVISSNISTFSATAGVGTLYVRAYLPSDTTTACEIDSIAVKGGHTNPSNSTNPNSFQISSVTGQSGQALVVWNAAAGATGYTVCYGTTQAQADSCAFTYNAGSSTSATITGLTNNTQYYFGVVATNSSGRSPASVPVSGLPVPAPVAPTNLVAKGGLLNVNLTWDAMSDATSYTILRGTSAGALTAYASGVTSNAFTDLTAGAGTTYYYAVRGVNASGVSSNSTVVSAMGLGAFNSTLVSAYNNTVTLSWAASTGASNYTVKYGTASGVYSTTLTNQTSPLTISGLTNETTYYFLVTANNSNGSANAQVELKATPWLYPNLSINNTTLNQGGTAQFTITLDQASLHQIRVTMSTSDGSAVAGTDYTARTNLLIFIPAGQTSKTFTVNTTPETTTAGATRNFTATLSNIQNALLSGSGIGVATLVDPTLAVDFTTEKLDPRIHFTRASAGTYFDSNHVMQISGTNLTLWSEDASQWTIHNDDGSESGPTAPSLTFTDVPGMSGNTVKKIHYSGVQTMRFMEDIGGLQNSDYTFSVWVKNTGTCNIGLSINDQGTWTGMVSSNNIPIETVNGWVRTSVTKNISTGGARFVFYIPAGNECIIGGAQFEKGSSATGYVKTTTTPAYLPRFDHDPVSGLVKGLLIEETRNNLALYSSQIDQNMGAWGGQNNASNWGLVRIAVTADQTTAPDGTTTADLIAGDNQQYPYAVSSRVAVTPSVPYTSSIFVKAGTLHEIMINNLFFDAGNSQVASSEYRYFSVDDCRVHFGNPFGGPTLGAVFSTQKLANGWCRVSLTTVAPATAASMSAMYYMSSGYRIDPTFTPSDNVYLWGAQVEQGTGVTSYIPTTSASVTRYADIASMDDLSWYSQTGGTMLVSSISNQSTSPYARAVTFDRSDFAYFAFLTYDSGFTSGLQTYDGSSFLGGAVALMNRDVVTRQAASFMNNYLAMSTNGKAVSSFVSPLPTFTNFRLGIDRSQTFVMNGHVRDVTYYNKNLDSYAVKALSTQTDRSCQTLLDAGNTTSGTYTVKPDGIHSQSVYCDMTTDGGGWTLVFNHKASAGFFTEAEALSKNSGTPTSDLYSSLDQLEKFRNDGKFTLKINWPGYPQRNIWSQTTNPTFDQPVAGYTGITIDSSTEDWGGLERNSAYQLTTSFMDGSIGNGNWYYAIAEYADWHGGIPASNTVLSGANGVPQVQLWVK